MDEFNRSTDITQSEDLALESLFHPPERFELLKLFIYEPEAEFSLEDIKWRLSQSPQTTKTHLNFYIKHGIFQKISKGSKQLFRLDPESMLVLVIRRVLDVWGS